MKKILAKIESKSSFKIWLLSLTISLVIGAVTMCFVISFNVPGENNFIEKLPTPMKLLVAIVVAPVVETLVFQTLIIEMFLVYPEKKLNTIAVIIISALAFGASHLFSLGYAIFAFLMGLNFALTYILFLKKTVNSTWAVSSVHASYNFILFLFSELITSRIFT